jgi:hypothetical protein
MLHFAALNLDGGFAVQWSRKGVNAHSERCHGDT